MSTTDKRIYFKRISSGRSLQTCSDDTDGEGRGVSFSRSKIKVNYYFFGSFRLFSAYFCFFRLYSIFLMIFSVFFFIIMGRDSLRYIAKMWGTLCETFWMKYSLGCSVTTAGYNEGAQFGRTIRTAWCEFINSTLNVLFELYELHSPSIQTIYIYI